MAGTATVSWINNSAGPIDPLNIVSSKTPFFFLSGDLGITLGTGVSAWADLSGNGANATQATGGNQPIYNATDSAFNNRGSVQGSALGALYLSVNWDPPAPGTTNIWFFMVMSLVASSTSFIFCGATGSSTLACLDNGSSSFSQLNTSSRNANSGAAAGTSVRGEILFSNSSADYTKFGSTTVASGLSCGNGDASMFRLLNRNGSTQGSNTKLACIGAWNGDPASGEKILLNNWVSQYYGSGIII